MSTDTMTLANVHLRKAQKHALQARAKAHGTNLAEEVRNAVDAYLAGVTTDELSMLDAATKHTATMLEEIASVLETTNRNVNRMFQQMAKLRGGYPDGAK